MAFPEFNDRQLKNYIYTACIEEFPDIKDIDIRNVLNKLFFPFAFHISNNITREKFPVNKYEIARKILNFLSPAYPHRVNEILLLLNEHEQNVNDPNQGLTDVEEGGFIGGAFPKLRKFENAILLEALYAIHQDYAYDLYPIARDLMIPSSEDIKHNLMKYLTSTVSQNKKRRYLGRIIALCSRLLGNPVLNDRMNQIIEMAQSMTREINSRERNQGISEEEESEESENEGHGRKRNGGYMGGAFNQLGGMAQNAIKRIIFGIVRTPLHRMIPIVLGKLYFPDSRTVIENIRNMDRNDRVWNEYKEILKAIPDPFNRNHEIVNYIDEHIAGRL